MRVYVGKYSHTHTHMRARLKYKTTRRIKFPSGYFVHEHNSNDNN